MKVQEIRKIAGRMNIKHGKMNKTELIRAIQRAEGNTDCFGQGQDCKETSCLWRKDCLNC